MGRAKPYLIRLLVVVAVVGVGWATTLQARTSARLDAERRADAEFDRAVGRVLDRLESESGRFEDLLLATAGNVRSGTTVEDFTAFVDQIALHDRYPGAIGLAYIDRLPGPPEQGILRFVVPQPDVAVAGIDVLALPEIGSAHLSPVDGRAQMTARLLTLERALNIQEHIDGALFALVQVVGDPAAPTGWVALPVVAQELASWLAAGDTDVVEVRLYDGAEPADENRLTPAPAGGSSPRTALERQRVFGRTWTVEVRQAGPIHVEAATDIVAVAGGAGTVTMAVVAWVVLTAFARRRRAVARLEHRASHDELTGLPNRRFLRQRLSDALGDPGGDRHVALLYCDLDRFKVANDSLGHTVGDRLLIEVSERFRRSVREGDLVARLGGDEFAVACEVADEKEALAVAERLRAALVDPFALDGHEIYLSVSVGVAIATHADLEQLIADADSAMYRSKDAGRSRVTAASTGERTATHERLQLEAALHHAVDRDELRVHYQPVVSLADEQPIGFEALVRWEHPTMGLLAPDRFITLAEESDLISAIGAWVLRRACRDWAESGAFASIAVNLSPRQLFDPHLVDIVGEALQASSMPAEALTLEITESVLTTPAAGAQAARLRDLGVRVAVDDFGTGYSSLASLRHLPVDVLKIDQRFVAGMGQDPVDDAVVEAVVRLGSTLGLAVVAEGVETRTQADALRAVGCHLAQGYLFARPAPLELLAAAAVPVANA